jgi:5-methylcytosine-specific restriction endonuclease McrA
MCQHIGLFCSCEGRYCRGCDQTKCQRAFSKDPKGAFGLSSRCKECIRDYQKSHIDQINARRKEYYQENADRLRAQKRENTRKNPEPKKARDRQYRQENAERIKVYIRDYKRTNEAYQEKKRESYREYMRLHPEKSAEYFHNRRARELQASGSFTSREWKKLCKHYNYTCLRCGRREPQIKLTVDHVIPLSVGGTNSIDNIQPLCQSCNSSKGITSIDYRVNWE